MDPALDIYHPTPIRSSTGACFLGNLYGLSTEAAFRVFQETGYRIVPAAVDGDASLFDADLRGKIVIALGAEDMGLDDRWLGNADLRVKIPMTGQLSDSLNVSVSGAIFMYEVLRQRQAAST